VSASAGTSRQIVARALSAEDWAPFGWIPVIDSDPADGTHRLVFELGDPHLNIISHDVSEVMMDSSGMWCEKMYRHDTHTQVLCPLDVPAVIAVAPAGRSLEDPAQADSIAAFILEPCQAVVMHRGTWHWGPFPVRDGAVNLLNVQSIAYLDDNTCVDLAAAGTAVSVVVG